jgi:hypothetical protein
MTSQTEKLCQEQVYRFGQLTDLMQQELRELRFQVAELLRQIEELLPFLVDEVNEGLKFASDCSYHDDDGCPECVNFRWAALMKARLDNGDFGLQNLLETDS